MSDIFISYKREEQSKARKLADALEAQAEGWSVWWDEKLQAGEHFDEVIKKALNDAQCVIVLWSQRSTESRYIKDEATYALEKGKLLPVKIDNAELPLGFGRIHTSSYGTPRCFFWSSRRRTSRVRPGPTSTCGS